MLIISHEWETSTVQSAQVTFTARWAGCYDILGAPRWLLVIRTITGKFGNTRRVGTSSKISACLKGRVCTAERRDSQEETPGSSGLMSALKCARRIIGQVAGAECEKRGRRMCE